MASNGAPITLAITPAVQAGHTVAAAATPKPAAAAVRASAGKATPADAVAGAAAVAQTASPSTQTDLRALVTQLNQHLNNSGRPDQFRVDPHSSKTIQEINPATGTVIGEFAASEFPALARSIGASGLLVDSTA